VIRVNPHANQALGPHLPFTQRVKEEQMAEPVDFVVKKLPYNLTSHVGMPAVLIACQPPCTGQWSTMTSRTRRRALNFHAA
jgi:hypothetical protein